MKIRVLSILILFFVFGFGGHGQSGNPYVPKILSPSPNAASLMKFTDVPVSMYNGTADVNVPFFSVDVKDMSVPVGIAYHTGGVRMREESGIVGLGWALNAGGMISREFRDNDDFGGQYLGAPVPEFSGNVLSQPSGCHSACNFGNAYIFFCNYMLYTDQGNFDYSTALQSSVLIWDMEPDIFSYNFPGHSGKFMITRAGNVIMQKQENIVIKFSSGGAAFTITDDQGNKFYFADKETVQSAAYVGPRTSSWLLTSITTQSGDIITFTYSTDDIWSYVDADKTESRRYVCAGYETPSSTQPYANQFLNRVVQTIDYAKGQVQFVYDNVREDIQNAGKKLKTVKIYNKPAGNSTLNYLKEYNLFYSYFLAGQTPLTEYERLRLDSVQESSTGITLPPHRFAYNDGSAFYGTSKRGYAVDHWGFYNGQSNYSFIPNFSALINQGYINHQGANREADPEKAKCFSLRQVTYPTGGHTDLEYEANDYDQVKSTTGPPDFPYFQLIDKFPNIPITTKGSIQTGSVDMSNIYPVSYVTSNASITVTFVCNSTVGPELRNTFGKVYFEFNGVHYDVGSSSPDFHCQSNNCTITDEINIGSATPHPWSAFITSDPSISGQLIQISATIRWQEIKTAANPHLPLTGGGLRIKSITDYSSSSLVAKKRKYIYGNESATNPLTYGRLMSFPSYARMEIFYHGVPPGGVSNTLGPETGTYQCNSLMLTGSSNSSVSSVINGNIIGYDTVKEVLVDPVTGFDIGRTSYAYFNSSDTNVFYNSYRMPGIPNTGNNLNGSLLSKIVYKNVNNNYLPVTETDNFYHTTNRIAINSAKFQLLTNPSGYSTDCPNNMCVANEYQANYYKALKSERILMDSTYETVYDQFDPTRFTVTKKYYSYDNPKHYQVTRVKQTDSKGDLIINTTKYPQDYIPGGNTWSGNTILDSMIKRNMVAAGIETRDSLLFKGAPPGFITGAKLNIYKILANGSIKTDKNYLLSLAGPVNNFTPFTVNNNVTSQDSRYRQMISFDSYDNLSNIRQYTASDQIPTSFIWDYANMSPIAQVKNAINTDIAFSSFEADGSGNWTFPVAGVSPAFALTGTKSYLLSASNTIAKSGLTSGKKYILSYWARGSACTFNGATSTSTTGRSFSGWTYFEHVLTTTATSITVNGVAYIDELRLYPQGAQMTSLTYAPVVGATSSNDLNSEVTYYEYDNLQRLKNVKDYLGNITNNFQYNYGQPCTSCVVPMQTYAHTPTLSYPVGVFSVSDKLLGNATTQAQFISLWNSSTDNQAVGTLAAGSDSMHFILNVGAGKTSPGFVTGCRYYQYDLPYTQFDAVISRLGAYVDFGDGNGMSTGKFEGDSTVPLPPSTTAYIYYSSGAHMYWVHNYPNSSLKTLTFYHNDGYTSNVPDNNISPASSLMLLSNLRGNLPQNCSVFGANCFQQASAQKISSITNWNSISSITEFWMVSGDFLNPCLNVNYPQDFMANQRNLNTIFTTRGYYLEGYEDATFKLSKLKTNWNTYFLNLKTITICDDHWNREDLSYLLNLSRFELFAGNQNHNFSQVNNPLIAIPVSVIDNIINQIAAGAGRSVTNGKINISSAGTTRSSASDNGFNILKAKNWTIIINGVTL